MHAGYLAHWAGTWSWISGLGAYSLDSAGRAWRDARANRGKWCVACGLGEQAWPRVLQYGCLLCVAAWEGDVQLDLACFGGPPCMGADLREVAAGACV